MNYTLSIFVIAAFFLASCSNRVTGLYYDKDFNQNTPDYIFISICSDSVHYLAHNDIIGKADYRGTWKTIADTLILDIPKPCLSRASQLIELNNPSLDTKRIQCSLLRSCGDTLTLAYDTLVINDNIVIPIDSIGNAYHQVESINKIEINGMFDESFTDTIFYLNESTKNEISLRIGETDEWQLASFSLLNSKYLIDGNSLRVISQTEDSVEISKFKYRRHGKCKILK
jgi:hypothetical protein